MSDLSVDEFEELKQDIVERGVIVAVQYYGQENVLDGHHRIKACQEHRSFKAPSASRHRQNTAVERSGAAILCLSASDLLALLLGAASALLSDPK